MNLSRPHKLISPKLWRERFADITALERYLSRNGTVILKFFLNISKKKQRERFLERLEQPAKTWKFSMGDVTERAFWPRYMAAYQDIIRRTSTSHAPWHLVPADHKWFARVVIGSAIVRALEELNLHFPPGRQGLAGGICASAQGARERRQEGCEKAGQGGQEAGQTGCQAPVMACVDPAQCSRPCPHESRSQSSYRRVECHRRCCCRQGRD